MRRFTWPNPRFYEAPPIDRELTAEMVRALVSEQFPELAVATVARLGEGWEHETQ